MTDNIHHTHTTVVRGDVTLDWNLVEDRHPEACPQGWDPQNHTRVCRSKGGALLAADLVACLAEEISKGEGPAWSVNRPKKKVGRIQPDDHSIYHSYAIWKRFPFSDKPDEEGKAWRVVEFLGNDQVACQPEPQAKSDGDQDLFEQPIDLVILDDANLGFRSASTKLLQALEQSGRRPWIILKMSSPIAKGELWEGLLKQHRQRLVVVIGVNELRASEVQISREISWERTAQDAFRELVSNPRVNQLSTCRAVIVTFRASGALLLEPGNDMPRATLFYDPVHIESTWEAGFPGGMIGYKTCMVGSLAAQVMVNQDSPDLHKAIQRGLEGMRSLHKTGYADPEKDPKQVELAFPIEAISQVLLQDGAVQFSQVKVRYPQSASAIRASALSPSGRKPKQGDWQLPGHCKEERTAYPGNQDEWSILYELYQDRFNACSRAVALEGPEKVMPDAPRGKFGELVVVGRREIESLRSLQARVEEYTSRSDINQPLSIAVFGAPGSGKSFTIKSVAKALLKEIEDKTFNLSQFGQEEDLINALHQVRDLTLKGKLPLIFWDEFDTRFQNQALGWLRFFLSPMQDGEFQDGQITHPIGRCIFVFAGGTYTSMAQFIADENKPAVKKAKLPDFISRLKGFIDIAGPNPLDDNDASYPIRRAILLRSMLGRQAPRLFGEPRGKGTARIDSGVLRAFLNISTFYHGSRSMESLLAMSQLTGKTLFERSSLPAEEQLELHVPAGEFIALVEQVELEDDLLKRLAAAIHKYYSKVRKEELASKPGAIIGREDAYWNLQFEELPEEIKNRNLQQARDFPQKLALSGFLMRQRQEGDEFDSFSENEVERLAIQEHYRWMLEKLEKGWRWGERDEIRKTNPNLLPWHAMDEAERKAFFGEEFAARLGEGTLPEKEKEINRQNIRYIPEMLRGIGYTVLKQPEDPAPLLLGVTGHRFLAEVSKLEAAIDQALEELEQRYPGRPLRLYSALAEGADRLAAERALLRKGAGLVAVLPMPKDVYMEDFVTPESKAQFERLLAKAQDCYIFPERATRDESYENGARFILRHCQVLVAVWDGQEAQGTAGTGQIVAEARERGMPLAWIKAGNRKPGTNEPTSLGEQQGMVVFERLEETQ